MLNLYSEKLRDSLEKTAPIVAEILEQDSENQISTFLYSTLESMNQASIQEAELSGNLKLTLKNVEGMWQKYFPPCMMSLTQVLKQRGHLRHDGRRQLWLFFKGCGMSSIDNQ